MLSISSVIDGFAGEAAFGVSTVLGRFGMFDIQTANSVLAMYFAYFVQIV